MTDETTTPEPTGVPIEPKTTEAPNPAESSTPKPEKKPEIKAEAEPEKKDLDTILKDSLKKAQEGKEEKKPEPKADDKAKDQPEPKEETPEQKADRQRNPDGKFAPKEAKEPSEESEEGAGKEGEKTRSSEGRNIDVPPSRFTAKAKERWLTADPEIRREMWRAHDEMEKGLNESKDDREFRKSVREFEDMATAAGTTFPDAIRNYVEIDRMVSTNPVGGIQRILAAQGIDLVQFSQHVLQQAQQAQQDPKGAALNQYQQREQQLQSQIQQQAKQLEEMQRAIAYQQADQKYVAPFRNNSAEYPRFTELEGHIASLLNSGIIPSNMSEHERLAAAYDAAVRLNPAPLAQKDNEPLTPAPATKSLNPAGQKSVTGAPSASAVTSTKAKGDATDLDAVLRRALSKAS